jgi:capsular polysaccharide transport system ATP-binding protein
MIVFENASKSYGDIANATPIFENLNLEIDSTKKIAVLGPKASGKTTFIHMVAGVELPSSGKVVRYARVSLPVGYARAFKPISTAKDNIMFLARCYGAKADEVMEFVREVAELDDELERPLRALRQDVRQRIAYTLGYALPFDTYLIDHMAAVGTPDFREKCYAMLAERAKTAGVLYATSDPRTAKAYCDEALLISDRKVHHYTDLEQALWNLSNPGRATG